MIIPLYEAGCPHVTHPSAAKIYQKQAFNISPLDLHVLSTPPAFILSQDQTLMFNLFLSHCWLSFFFSFSYLSIFFKISFSLLTWVLFFQLFSFQGSLPFSLCPPLGDSLISISHCSSPVNTFFKILIVIFCWHFCFSKRYINSFSIFCQHFLYLFF